MILIVLYNQYWLCRTHTEAFSLLTVASCNSGLRLDLILLVFSFSEGLLMRNTQYLMSESVFINTYFENSFCLFIILSRLVLLSTLWILYYCLLAPMG